MTPQPIVERRILVAMMRESHVLELCADLELGDLSDYRHRAILTAIRELQETGEDVDRQSIVRAIAMRDMKRDTHVAESVTERWLDELCDESHVAVDADGPVAVRVAPSYGDGASVLVPFDLGQLRRIARSNA